MRPIVATRKDANPTSHNVSLFNRSTRNRHPMGRQPTVRMRAFFNFIFFNHFVAIPTCQFSGWSRSAPGFIEALRSDRARAGRIDLLRTTRFHREGTMIRRTKTRCFACRCGASRQLSRWHGCLWWADRAARARKKGKSARGKKKTNGKKARPPAKRAAAGKRSGAGKDTPRALKTWRARKKSAAGQGKSASRAEVRLSVRRQAGIGQIHTPQARGGNRNESGFGAEGPQSQSAKTSGCGPVR